MTTKLNAHQQALLDILGVNGGWMREEEIAHQMGKDMLAPEDVMQLDLLGDAGMLAKEISDDSSPDGGHVRYRVAEPKAELKTHGGGR
ncbi:MAG: hypothetical protein ABI690_17565 [Chloroflexota bacterium]